VDRGQTLLVGGAVPLCGRAARPPACSWRRGVISTVLLGKGAQVKFLAGFQAQLRSGRNPRRSTGIGTGLNVSLLTQGRRYGWRVCSSAFCAADISSKRFQVAALSNGGPSIGSMRLLVIGCTGLIALPISSPQAGGPIIPGGEPKPNTKTQSSTDVLLAGRPCGSGPQIYRHTSICAALGEHVAILRCCSP